MQEQRNDAARRPALTRLDTVDVLRGLSIGAVVLLHILIRFSFAGVHLGADWPKLARRIVFFNGGNGVTVFFAVSGFLITLTSLRRFGSLAAMRPAIFYRIRFARIMPLLLLLLAVLSVLHLAHVDGYVVNARHFTLARALFSALTFHLNWLEASRDAWLPACWTVLWSLSIEEMFYLFFPLACVLLLRRGRWGAVAWLGVALLLVALGPPARTAWSHTDLWRENSYLGGMASIALGCLTAWITDAAIRTRKTRTWTRKTRTWVTWMAQIAGIALIVLIEIWPKWPLMKMLGKTGLDDTMVALSVCLIVFATTVRSAHSSRLGVAGSRLTAPLRWFGRHSYEVYLSHEFLVIAGIELFARCYPHGTSRVLIALFVVAILALTAPLGWALAKLFSEPLNRKLRGAAPAAVTA
jgi:peptidoglycan/LPS O-acetylase OafA/YrhL